MIRLLTKTQRKNELHTGCTYPDTKIVKHDKQNKQEKKIFFVE